MDILVFARENETDYVSISASTVVPRFSPPASMQEEQPEAGQRLDDDCPGAAAAAAQAGTSVSLRTHR